MGIFDLILIRLSKVLQNAGWKELFEQCPLEVVQKRCIISPLQAMGESV